MYFPLLVEVVNEIANIVTILVNQSYRQRLLLYKIEGDGKFRYTVMTNLAIDYSTRVP